MIGVGIIAFKRAFYLRRLIKSLEAQTDLSGINFHFFQDGWVNEFSGLVYAHDHEIAQSVKTFNMAKLPNKELHRRERHVSVGINSFEAWEYMTERYDKVMMMENDVILSPHWFRLANILYNETPDDVFSFSPGFIRQCEKADIDQHLNSMTVPESFHFWCECFTPEKWNNIRPLYLDFYDTFIRGIDFNMRNAQDIINWHSEHGNPCDITTQDAGIQTSIWALGLKHACCTVNRGMGIGMIGLDFREPLFAEFGFAQQMPYVFDSDATLDGFKWL